MYRRSMATALGLAAGLLAQGAPAASAAAATHCSAAALRVTVEDGGAGVGHRGYLLVFTNVSRTTCTVTGYPHVFIDDASRRPVQGAARTPSGYLGGLPAGAKPPVVTLAPGRRASALLEGLALVTRTGDGCPIRPFLSVTAPQTFRAKRIHVYTQICSDVVVHPVTARG